MSAAIRVLIADGSASVRVQIKRGLAAFTDLEILATAVHGRFALEKIARLEPDVVVLGLQMPHVAELLAALEFAQAVGVVVVGAAASHVEDVVQRLTARRRVVSLRNPSSQELESEGFHGRVRQAVLQVCRERDGRAPPCGRPIAVPALPSLIQAPCAERVDVVGIGASTGGPEAVADLLGQLPRMLPILVTQHLPPEFAHVFAERLDETTVHTVRAATQGEVLRPGHVYIGASDAHLQVRRTAMGELVCHLVDDPPVSHHRPAVDKLFGSLAEAVGPRALAVLLTGMGRDGARGMLAMRQQGARTIAQDEPSCVVYGMPRAAAEIHAAGSVLPLSKIGDEVLRLCRLDIVGARRFVQSGSSRT